MTKYINDPQGVEKIVSVKGTSLRHGDIIFIRGSEKKTGWSGQYVVKKLVTHFGAIKFIAIAREDSAASLEIESEKSYDKLIMSHREELDKTTLLTGDLVGFVWASMPGTTSDPHIFLSYKQDTYHFRNLLTENNVEIKSSDISTIYRLSIEHLKCTYRYKFD